MKAQRHLLAALAAIGLVGTGAALRTGPSVAHATPAASAIPTDGTIADVSEKTMDSVVEITMTGQTEEDDDMMDPSSFFGGGFGRPEQKIGQASGVIVT